MILLAYALLVGVFPVNDNLAYLMTYEALAEAMLLWGWIIIGSLKAVR